MKRYIRLCLLSLFFVLFAPTGIYATKVILEEAVIEAESVKVILKTDTTRIVKQLVVKGTLIIEPGAVIEFDMNGRIIIATSGRVIADGFANLQHKIPSGLIQNPGTVSSNPNFFDGFHDIKFFLYPIAGGLGTTFGGNTMYAGLSASERLTRERTIHPEKYNTIFNVAIDTLKRSIVNIKDPNDSWPFIDVADGTGRYSNQTLFAQRGNTHQFVVPFETAIMFMAARMDEFPETNPTLRTSPWARINTTESVNITPNRIKFLGQPQGQFSREWGHIIVLPGARAAFFRNCLFENIRKDTTVDNVPFYANVSSNDPKIDVTYYDLTPLEQKDLNDIMLYATNGGGGAITTFSSRTWLVDCEFSKNFARLRGGAVQILQAPTYHFYPGTLENKIALMQSDTAGCYRFNFTDPELVKNFRVSDPDKLTSTVLTRSIIPYPMIDRIDEGRNNQSYFDERDPFINDTIRQAWDDARVAGYLGRFRNLTFNNNRVNLANITAAPINPNDPSVTRDDTTAVLYPYKWGNCVQGGAMYIAGADSENREMEFALGMNDKIKLGDRRIGSEFFKGPDFYNPNNGLKASATLTFKDYLIFSNNSAHNFQDSKSSFGSQGGAIYVGKNTSLIVAGHFENNFTHAKYLVDTTGKGINDIPTSYEDAISYSRGGAIYAEPNRNGRIQVRGDLEKLNMTKWNTEFNSVPLPKNTTMFRNNRAGAGGAIFVEASSDDPLMSPFIGGSDITSEFNHYGYWIEFNNNRAWAAGGAVYTMRNMEVSGSGGAQQYYIYSIDNIVRFDSNSAGFSGGAIHIEVPIGTHYPLDPPIRIINLRRAEFKDNNVNKLAFFDVSHKNNLLHKEVRGGGAVYTLWADPNIVRGVTFVGNTVYNGNGGAMEMICPNKETPRLFVTDLDVIHYFSDQEMAAKFEDPSVYWAKKDQYSKVAKGFTSVNNPFTYGANYNDVPLYKVEYPDEKYIIDGKDSLVLRAGAVSNPHMRMLNIFDSNLAVVDNDKGQEQIELYGNTQMGNGYVMPGANNMGQYWTSIDNGFVGGNQQHTVNIKYQNSKWNWSEPFNFNDSLASWGKVPYGFSSIHFVNPQTGYYASTNGMILKHTPSGQQLWSIVHNPNVGESISDMSFIIGGASDRAIAVTTQGNIVTTDDGTTWNTTSITNKKLNGVHFVNGSLAFAVGTDGTVMKITRPATGWDFESIYAGVNRDLNKVYFINANRGFTIGTDGTYLSTTDAGVTWNLLIDVFPRNENLIDIKFYSTQIGYILASNGRLWKTTNGGDNWAEVHNFFRTTNSVFLLDYDKLFVVGDNDLVMRSLDGGENWLSLEPTNKAGQLGNPRTHGNKPNSTLVENGIGLGGAIYILDNMIRNDQEVYVDSIHFNRTRILDNFAFSGSAVYSDNYNLKLYFNRSLIRGNRCDVENTIGMEQNHITGPFNRQSQYKERNDASSDLASATIYGEIEGPFPSNNFSTLANSIFDNEARFLIRLPDAPNTKGILQGQGVDKVGAGGVNILKGNYWGRTQADVGLVIMNFHENHAGDQLANDNFMTFFVEKKITRDSTLKADKNYLPFFNDWNNITKFPDQDKRRQGPFEYSVSDYKDDANRVGYTYIELKNVDNNENMPADQTIPEKYLFSYDVYDYHDKTTDIKSADYSKRRMFPIEDFAVGNPVQVIIDHEGSTDVEGFVDLNYPETSTQRKKYVRRWIRDPEYADAKNPDGTIKYPEINRMQKTWSPMDVVDNTPRYYQPLGMPMYLETKARSYVGDFQTTNRDIRHPGSTVFFVINETTKDFIRIDMRQISREYPQYEVNKLWYTDDFYRATIFLVPDSSGHMESNSSIRGVRTDASIAARRRAEGLRDLTTNGTHPFGGQSPPTMLGNLSPRALQGSASDNLPEVIAAYNGIDSAARNEDYAALGGRKYGARSDNYVNQPGSHPNLDGKPYQTYFNLGDDGTALRRMQGLFSNRPTMPDNNYKMRNNNTVGLNDENETYTTYYGGEKYGTLPANVGDVIRVVSRNVLWRQGAYAAYEGGLVFIVKEGPEAPVFTGNITMWGTPTLNPYVTDTNRQYPVYVDKRLDENGNFVEDTIKNYGLLNKIFVRSGAYTHYSPSMEIMYPRPTGSYSDPRKPDNVRGTDFILTARAYDRNGFYDPRNEILANNYSDLIWGWNTVPFRNTALERWLMVDTIKTTDVEDGITYKGMLRFKGTPINPYIVPGGEKFQVRARNYPPGVSMIDSLRTLPGMTEEIIKQYYRTFPPYMNVPYYNRDVDSNDADQPTMVARYLQQDTIGMLGNEAVSEELTIFVMDSLPVFIPTLEEANNVQRYFAVKSAVYDVDAAGNDHSMRPYTFSHFQAGKTKTGTRLESPIGDARYLVNVTTNAGTAYLRFKMDLNTDDELEDASASVTESQVRGWDVPLTNWTFPYGRSSYSFANVVRYEGDEPRDGDTSHTLDTIIDQTFNSSTLRPSWLHNNFFMEYGNNRHTIQDAEMFEFQRRGQMNIRIPYADAEAMLRKREVNSMPESKQYNTDTMMAVVSNDGHGGTSTKYVNLYVNFQPEFLESATLEKAVEGKAYNLKRDNNNAIKIFDANDDQKHTFKLIYEDTDLSHYPAYDTAFYYFDDGEKVYEAPIVWTENMNKTPKWLKINPVSGILYSSNSTREPSVDDRDTTLVPIIRNLDDTNAYVTVLVEDEDGLINVRTYNMRVDPGNCPPKFLVAPMIECLTAGEEVKEKITLFDRDLLRNGLNEEQIELTVIQPQQGLKINPTSVTGGLDNDTTVVYLEHTGTGFSYNENDLIYDGTRLRVVIVAKDKKGATDTLRFDIRVSEKVEFLAQIKVANTLGHSQVLEWGTAADATTGDGNDKYSNHPDAPEGYLDVKYCEIEIPPLTDWDVFDARWAIPTINGTYRNIFPTAKKSMPENEILNVYKGTFQAGGVQAGGSSTNYPITLTWRPSEIPEVSDATKNPTGAKWILRDGGTPGNFFSIEMRTLAGGTMSAGVAEFINDGSGEVTIKIRDNRITNFHIIHDWYGTDVENEELFVTAINRINPNPISSSDVSATLDFSIGKAGYVTIEIFDVLGDKVATIDNDFYGAGNYAIGFNLKNYNGSNLASGSYTVRLTSGMEIKNFSFIVIQ